MIRDNLAAQIEAVVCWLRLLKGRVLEYCKHRLADQRIATVAAASRRTLLFAFWMRWGRFSFLLLVAECLRWWGVRCGCICGCLFWVEAGAGSRWSTRISECCWRFVWLLWLLWLLWLCCWQRCGRYGSRSGRVWERALAGSVGVGLWQLGESCFCAGLVRRLESRESECFF